jgi:hypothetical protein
MEHNIDLIKQIREAYAKEEGYKSFASMALNVNIVPRDITEIAKKYAEGINAELQARCDRYEKALKLVKGWIERARDNADSDIVKCAKDDLKYINEALNGEGEKEAGNEKD